MQLRNLGRISRTVGKILGWLFPIGLPIYLLATYRRKLLLHDIRTMTQVSNELLNILKNETYEPNEHD
ncbi:hypothetical protein [Tannerella forsythia]|uniref:hypothetical protein n=1 Tax=Tannerella forsythia TaxID=28112 RepID=UPI0028EC16E6|nr:hypothetical protein [Tannerella forsythia]